jgi:hypothetical protein
MSKIGIIGAPSPNGAAAAASLAQAQEAVATQGKLACVELLEKVLADAREGHVSSIALVAIGAGGFSPAVAGPNAPELNLGLDACKKIILDRVLTPRPSSVIMPKRRG